MLERVEPEIGQTRSVGMTIDPEHATFFVELVHLDFFHGGCHSRGSLNYLLSLLRIEAAFKKTMKIVDFRF